DGAVGWVRPDQPATPRPRGGQPLHAAQVVRRFRSAASRDAGRLAGYLAAAPLWMPVMQLVQRTMLPDSGPAELAEVLLGGLMRLDRDADAEGGPWYSFEPGVQDELLAPLTREEALLVLKHCSDYIERHFGKGSWNFPAVAAAQLDRGRSGIDWPVPHRGAGAGPLYLEGDEEAEEARRARSAVPHPFAEVAAHVLEQFMASPAPFAQDGEQADDAPDAVRSAWSLVRDYEADGMMQHLVDAVQLLRAAVAGDEREHPAGAAGGEQADEGRTEVRTALATCLLRLWEVQGGAGLLQEAEEAAGWAIARSGGARGRAVLAGILHAAADDRLRRGDERGALQLLQRADREYTAACAAPGMAPADALRLTLERVRALESEWRLGHDSALLQSAVGTLEAFSDAWPDQRNRPAALPLALGRMLLRLSGATEDTEQAQLYAKQAARSLRTALGEQNGVRQTGGTQASTVLDLADALLASGDGLDDGLTLVGRALGIVRDERLSAQLRLREGRLRLARYEAGAGAAPAGDPDELHEAIRAFELAARGTPRDTTAHADVLAEWGSALLRRASLPGEQEQVHAAVQVLRDCRAETAPEDPDQAGRLLMLGRALMIRHRIAEDRVDLREAEYLFGLAAREAGDPLTEALCWLELGEARFAAHRVLHRPTRLHEAAEAFREAADAGRRAEERANDATRALTGRAGDAIALQGRAHHGRGRTHAEEDRPRAARDAYRAAREQWRKLPDGGGEEGRETLDRLAELDA
ncbi:hypothetical protein L1885_26910, partial [Streptomyces fuscigenes]|nr:hypothetical protein [Streptomyces fuscigenes]